MEAYKKFIGIKKTERKNGEIKRRESQLQFFFFKLIAQKDVMNLFG
jgi:hypothetical protein